MFDDFAYEHTSRKIYFYRGKPVVCFQWGGIALPNVEQQLPAVMGRARALASINMCSRARGDTGTDDRSAGTAQEREKRTASSVDAAASAIAGTASDSNAW